jgi:hypothetical protein
VTGEQHDDHVWLTVGGRGWAIYVMRGPLLTLWRGHYPYIEYSFLDISDVDWEAYHRAALKLLRKEYPF